MQVCDTKRQETWFEMKQKQNEELSTTHISTTLKGPQLKYLGTTDDNVCAEKGLTIISPAVSKTNRMQSSGGQSSSRQSSGGQSSGGQSSGRQNLGEQSNGRQSSSISKGEPQ